MYMPKLHDLCQQFWEEITITRNHPQSYPPEFIIAQAHRYMAESERARAGQRDGAEQPDGQRADIIAQHLAIIADEMDITHCSSANLSQLIESFFGKKT